MTPVDPRLLAHSRATRRHLVTATVVGAGAALLLVVQAFALTELVVRPVQGGAAGADLRGPLALLALTVAGRAALAWAAEVTAHRAAARVTSELRRALLTHALRLGPAWLARQQVGSLATLATRGVDALDGYFGRYLPALVNAVLVPPAVVVVLLTRDLWAAVTVLLTLPLLPVFAVLIGLATARQGRRQWRRLAGLAGHFLDVVEGLPTLLVFRRAQAQVATIRRITDEHRRATLATLRLAFLSSAVLELVATVSTALVAVSVGLRLVTGGLDLRTALVVLVLTPEAYWPLRLVGSHFHASAEGLAAADAVFAVLATPAPGLAGPGARTPAPDLRRTAIRLAGVAVTYDRAQPALDRLDLTLRPGEYLGVTGPSGAGKSTLLSVLLGSLPPSTGRVLLVPDADQVGPAGVDLADVDLDTWRAQVAWVPQNPWLAAASVADNVRLARPGADDAAVERALRLADADAFVAALPQGRDTLLGEGGAGLSAGQRQRLALARAFLREAPLVLLDEPTAHLDAESEAAIAAAVRRLAAGRTVVAVAHRPALLADADRVVVLGAQAAEAAA